MNKKEDKKEKYFKPVITFSGAGILHVKSSDLIQTETVKKQIDALELNPPMKKEGIFADCFCSGWRICVCNDLDSIALPCGKRVWTQALS